MGRPPSETMEPLQKPWKRWSPLAWLSVALISIILISLLIPAIVGARERANRIHCMSRFRQIGLAVKQYSTDHGKLYPESGLPTVSSNFRLLSNLLGNVGLLFVCPSDKSKIVTEQASELTDENVSYCYVRGLNDDAPIDMPLSFDRGFGIKTGCPLGDYNAKTWQSSSPHGVEGGNVLFCGLHVVWRKGLNEPDAVGWRGINLKALTNQVLVPE